MIRRLWYAPIQPARLVQPLELHSSPCVHIQRSVEQTRLVGSVMTQAHPLTLHQ